MEEKIKNKPESIKIIENALERMKEYEKESSIEQKTIQDINNKLNQMQEQLNRITNAIV